MTTCHSAFWLLLQCSVPLYKGHTLLHVACATCSLSRSRAWLSLSLSLSLSLEPRVHSLSLVGFLARLSLGVRRRALSCPLVPRASGLLVSLSRFPSRQPLFNFDKKNYAQKIQILSQHKWKDCCAQKIAQTCINQFQYNNLHTKLLNHCNILYEIHIIGQATPYKHRTRS